MRHRLAVRGTVLAWAVWPTLSHASNFSVLMYFLYGVCAVLAAGLAFAAYHLARSLASRLGRSLVWGSWMALVLTPLEIAGGNGRLSGTPLLAFSSLVFGADPAYIVGAAQVMLVALPLCTAMVWLLQYLWAAAADPKGEAGDDS